MDIHHLKRSVPASVASLLLCVLATGHGTAAATDATAMKLWTAVDTPLNRVYVQQFSKILKTESAGKITARLVSHDKISTIAKALHGRGNKKADLYLMPWAALASFYGTAATWAHTTLGEGTTVPQITVPGYLPKKHDDLIFYVISQYLSGITKYVMKTPVHSIDDLKGKKIRIAGGSSIYFHLFRKFGAVPVPSLNDDEPPPGRTNVIDGANLPMMVKSWGIGWHKNTPNLVINPNAYTATFALLSDAWFSKLPGDSRTAVLNTGAKMTDWAKVTGLNSNKELTKDWLGMGGAVQFIPLLSDKEKAAWTKIYPSTLDKTIAEMSAVLTGSSMKSQF